MMRRNARNRRTAPRTIAQGFDPATLALTGWWRADYAGSPWTPTASAGTSGSNGNLASASYEPTVGAAVNGYTPADYNGTDDLLDSSATFADLFNYNAGTILCLMKLDTIAAASANLFQDTTILMEAGVNFAFAVNDAGVGAAIYSGGWKQTATPVAVSTGAWFWAALTWDGTAHKVSVNGGAWTSTACGNVDAGAVGVMRTGISFGTPFLDGQILELMTSDTVISDENITNVIGYGNSRYGLAL